MAITPRESEIQKLVRFYRKLVRQLSVDFAGQVSIEREQTYAIMSSALAALERVDQQAERWARKNIAKLYWIVKKESDDLLKSKGLKPAAIDVRRRFALVNTAAVEALLNDPEVGFLTVMSQATDQIRRRMRLIRDQAKLLRSQQSALNQTIASASLTRGKSLREVKTSLMRDILKAKNTADLVWKRTLSGTGETNIISNLNNLPFVKIPTRLGERLLRIDHYAELVARTKTAMATNLARRNSILESGHGLIQISRNLSKIDDACNLYIGRAFALTKAAAEEWGVPMVDQLPNGGAPFHPNCTHSELAFFPVLTGDEDLERALTRPPDWALNQPWNVVEKEYRRRGGMSFAQQNNPNFNRAQNTGGRQRRLQREGR